MRCGVLCDASGNILRKWALINDPSVIVPEPGQTVVEWETDHGEQLPPGPDKEARTEHALDEQDRIHALQTHNDVLAHGKQRGHRMTDRTGALKKNGLT